MSTFVQHARVYIQQINGYPIPTVKILLNNLILLFLWFDFEFIGTAHRVEIKSTFFPFHSDKMKTKSFADAMLACCDAVCRFYDEKKITLHLKMPGSILHLDISAVCRSSFQSDIQFFFLLSCLLSFYPLHLSAFALHLMPKRCVCIIIFCSFSYVICLEAIDQPKDDLFV